MANRENMYSSVGLLSFFLSLLRLQLSHCSEQEPAAGEISLSVQHTVNTNNYVVKELGGVKWRGEGVFLPADHPHRRLLQPYGWPALYSPDRSKRRLLQTPGAAVHFSPIRVVYNGKPCILFRTRKLAIRYRNSSFVDLTERAFSTDNPVDTKGSTCSKDKATLVMRFGDVEHLRALAIRLQMSNTFYESAGQNWFSLDSVSIHYNWTQEAGFNASEVYAPSTSSYHCQHVSSLQRYDTLLVPRSQSDNSNNWHITFTDFQIQAFNVMSGKFASASDCATFLTPAILMGLITSLILLLVLAYALHMVIHLKHIDHYNEHKTTVYFPRSPEQAEHCSVANITALDKNTL